MIATITDRFRRIAELALRAAPNVEQIAKVNHLDNFTVHFAPVVQDAITGCIGISDPAETEWFNAYCDTPKPRKEGRYEIMRPACDNELNRAVCKTVYDILRK